MRAEGDARVRVESSAKLELCTDTHNLDELNMWLAGFGCDAAPSKRIAVKELAKINANIYDVMDGVYKNHKSLWKLAWYTKQNQMIFPLKEAKEDNRKIFLKNLKHCW